MSCGITSRPTISFFITTIQLSPGFLDQTNPNFRFLTARKGQGSVLFDREIIVNDDSLLVSIDVKENKIDSSLINFLVVEQCHYLLRVFSHAS